jgi:hypothetical protein
VSGRQGGFVIPTLATKNLQNKTNLLKTWGFNMVSTKGISHDTSSESTTDLLFASDKGAKPLTMGQVQPGLTQTFRLVFDVNPAEKGYPLSAAVIPVSIHLS